jgi:LCP family protein required for cell wall assembly
MKLDSPSAGEPISAVNGPSPPDPIAASPASDVDTQQATSSRALDEFLADATAGDESPDDAEPQEPAPVRAGVLGAAALSWLFPGLGQLVLRRNGSAVLFGVPAALFVVWAFLQFVSQGAALFAVSLWDDSYFQVFMAAVLVFGLWRLVAVAHVLYEELRGRRWRVVEGLVAGLLLTTIVATHVAVAGAAWVWYDTSVQINQNDFFADASPTPTPSPTASPKPTAKPTPRPQYSFPWSEAAEPTNPYPASSPTKPPNKNRLTFLLIGLDFMDGRSHSLTDSLMVVSIDMHTAKVSMVSVPRDTSAFQLYYGPWVGYNFKINTLLNSVDNGRLKSPDSGIVTLEKEIGFLVGIPIDYYAAVDIDGFIKLVDAVGGVDVDNKHTINDPPFLILPKGPAHLDGNTAMRYVRSREHGGNDYLRAARQQEVLKNLEAKITSPDMVTELPTILTVASDNLSTNFPLKTAKNYVKLGQRVKVDGCVLGPPYNWHPASSTTGGLWTSRLDLNRVASLSVYYFGADSAYYGQPGVTPVPCQSNP